MFKVRMFGKGVLALAGLIATPAFANKAVTPAAVLKNLWRHRRSYLWRQPDDGKGAVNAFLAAPTEPT